MTFLVPYDDSVLAEAALTRASEYADALEEDVTVVSVVPDDETYAEEKGWYDPAEDEEFSTTYVAGKLHKQVTNVAPEAAFRFEEPDLATAATIADRIEAVADDVLPSVVFLGTDNVGEIAEPLTSVAGGVAEAAEYDVHVVRYFSPTAIQQIDARPTYPEE